MALRLRLIGLLTAGLLFASPSLLAQQPAEELTPEQRQARMEELRSTIEQLKTELEQVKTNRSDLMDDLQDSEKAIGELNEKVQQLQQQMRNEQSRLDELRGEKEALTSAKKQQQGTVARHLNAAYRLGQHNSLKLLLNQQNPEQISRNIRYFRYLVSARRDKITQFEQTLQRIDQIEPEIAASVATIAQRHSRLQQQQSSLHDRQQQRQQTLVRLNRIIAEKDASLEVLEADREQLQKLLKRVVSVMGEIDLPVSDRPFGQLKGQLPWPTQGALVHRYGASRMAGKVKWRGLLIGAQEGNPVHAVHHGRVVFADYLRGHGLLVVIDHGEGYMSLYAHNQTLYKELGDWVESGEQIATVGMTGGRQDAGLYFELRYKGRPADPQPWLRKT